VGLTRRRALLAVTAALALLGTTACGPDDEVDEPVSVDETTTTEGDAVTGIGGSQHLAFMRSADAGFELVVEDLVDGGEQVVRTSDVPFAQVDVDADGVVAWAQEAGGETYEVGIATRADEDPVLVDAPDVACPRWRDDGSLLVVLRGEPDRLAIADPATGAREELAIDLQGSVCAAPAGLDHAVFPRPLGGETYGPEGGEIVRVALDDGEEDVVGHIPAECWANDVSVSPDGTRLAAGVLCEDGAGTEPSGLYVGSMDDDLTPLVAESEVAAPASVRYQYWAPSWSADGTTIAYHRYDPAGPRGATQIWTVSANGGDPAPHGPIGQVGPALSTG